MGGHRRGVETLLLHPRAVKEDGLSLELRALDRRAGVFEYQRLG